MENAALRSQRTLIESVVKLKPKESQRPIRAKKKSQRVSTNSMWKQAHCWKRGKTQKTRLGLRLAVVCICVVQKVACVSPTNHRGKWSKTIVFTFDTAKNNFQPGVERNPGLHKFLLHLSLWLSQKTSAIFSTNEMQNYYQSWLRHPRFPALVVVCLYFLWVLSG